MKVLLVSEGVHEESGALEALVRRVAPKVRTCVWRTVRSISSHAYHGKGRGFYKKALRCMLYAQKEGFDGLVLVIDEDGRRETISEMAQAQNDQAVTGLFPRAIGVAIRTFDAWMLADERALSTVLGVAVQTQPSPEENSDPKSSCTSLLSQSTCEIRPREMYAQISQNLDLRRLEERCPKGFSVFADRLRSVSRCFAKHPRLARKQG